jgi:hypothetical protein
MSVAPTSTDALMALIERLTARVADLEAWAGEQADHVITRAVTVVAPDGAPRIYLTAFQDWSSLTVMARRSDQGPTVSVCAHDEDGCDGYVAFRDHDEEVGFLGFENGGRSILCLFDHEGFETT